MIAATRRWLKRNRTSFAIGFGVIGAGYVAGQYILSKISETRERMNSDRIARENLRRRFQQNQEDCTFTVLALLPTATENILEALPVENITNELQQQRANKLSRSGVTSELAPSELSSGARSSGGDDGKSQASLQTDDFLHTSQIGSSTADASEPPKVKKTKKQLWDDLKIDSITRSFTLLYTLSLLTILTRIQLNLLGRRNYLTSVISMASPPRKNSTISLEDHDDGRSESTWGSDFDTNRKFLTFSWWLLHRGWRDVMSEVETAVKEVFSPLAPREEVSLGKLSELIVEVRKKIEGDSEEDRRNRKWLQYLLPSREQEDLVLQESGILADNHSSGSARSSPPATSLATPPTQSTLYSRMVASGSDPLRRLLDESADLIESPTATHIVTLLLDTVFSQLTDVALRSQAFKVVEPSADPSMRIQEVGGDWDASLDPEEAKTKLATILAVVTRQAHVIGNGVPNAYVQAMENVRELEAFAAVVYSSNFELDESAQAQAAGDIPTLDVGDDPATKPAERTTNSSGVTASTTGLFNGVWSRIVGSGG